MPPLPQGGRLHSFQEANDDEEADQNVDFETAKISDWSSTCFTSGHVFLLACHFSANSLLAVQPEDQRPFSSDLQPAGLLSLPPHL